MALGSDFIKSVEKGCSQALVERLGFRCRYGRPWLDYHDDYSGWIGLGTTTRQDPNAMGVWVNVGVVCWPVHNLVYDMDETEEARASRKNAMPTVFKTLGSLIWPPNGFYELWFSKSEPIEPSADKLVEDIQSHALPFMLAHTDLDAIIRSLEEIEKSRKGPMLLAAHILNGKRTLEQLGFFKDQWLADATKWYREDSIPEIRVVMDKLLAYASEHI